MKYLRLVFWNTACCQAASLTSLQSIAIAPAVYTVVGAGRQDCFRLSDNARGNPAALENMQKNSVQFLAARRQCGFIYPGTLALIYNQAGTNNVYNRKGEANYGQFIFPSRAVR